MFGIQQNFKILAIEKPQILSADDQGEELASISERIDANTKK